MGDTDVSLEELDAEVLAQYLAILQVFEEVHVFTQADRKRHALQLATDGMTADVLQADDITVARLEQFGLDPRSSLVLHKALTKLRLRWASPQAGVVSCREGQTVEFQISVAGGSGALQYRWYKHVVNPSGILEKRLLDCDTDRLRLTAVDINDSGDYSFCVTDAKGAQVRPETYLWELRVNLVRDLDELDARESWYQWLDEMIPRPRFHFAENTNKVKLDEAGLEALFPTFHSSVRGYILFKVTAEGPEKNSTTVIPCRNMDFLQDVIQLRTLVARPTELEHLLEQPRVSPSLLRNYIVSVLGGQPPKDANGEALVKHIKEHLEKGEAQQLPQLPVDLVKGKKELTGAHLGARFLVGQNGIYARGYGQLPANSPDLHVIRRPVQVPPGQEGLVQSLHARVQRPAALIPATGDRPPPKLVVGDVQPAASVHKMAAQSVGVSMGISLGIELLRSGYLYQHGQISGKEAAKQIGLTTLTGGLIAGGYTYASMALQQLAVSQAGNLAGQAARAILRGPNFAVGAVLVTVSTCVDLYRWNQGQITGRQLLENVAANGAATAASTAAVVGTATALGVAVATSWTGLGLLVLLGLGVGLAVDKLVRYGVRKFEERALLNRMRANALELLGLDDTSNDLDETKRKAVKGRYRAIILYLHPDKANLQPGANSTLCSLIKEARDFLLSPGTGFDLLVNFEGMGDGEREDS